MWRDDQKLMIALLQHMDKKLDQILALELPMDARLLLDEMYDTSRKAANLAKAHVCDGVVEQPAALKVAAVASPVTATIPAETKATPAAASRTLAAASDGVTTLLPTASAPTVTSESVAAAAADPTDPTERQSLPPATEPDAAIPPAPTPASIAASISATAVHIPPPPPPRPGVAPAPQPINGIWSNSGLAQSPYASAVPTANQPLAGQAQAPAVPQPIASQHVETAPATPQPIAAQADSAEASAAPSDPTPEASSPSAAPPPQAPVPQAPAGQASPAATGQAQAPPAAGKAPPAAPGQVPPAASGALTPKVSPLATAAKKTLVVVDDDQDIQRVLFYLFSRKSRFRVVSHTDPLKALEFIKAEVPEVVLTDLMMPGITGFELLKRIRELPHLANIKIMVGSSKSFDKDRVHVLKAGANDFVAKPYNFEELLLRLHKLAG